jgi:CxxC motif-containing protein (DUF1111 family)
LHIIINKCVSKTIYVLKKQMLIVSNNICQFCQYSLEATIDSENTPPVPGMGNQIQDQAVFANHPEATVEINWEEKTGQYKDRTTYKLRSPQAKNAKETFQNLSTSDRTAMIQFLQSL